MSVSQTDPILLPPGLFLPNMAKVLAPLYKLVRKEVRLTVAEKRPSRLQKIYSALNPDLEMCDASTYRVGAALTHRMPDGSDRPIGYASR